METIAKIRRMHFVERKKIKTIARELRISKNTVKDIIKNNIIKRQYVRENQTYPVLGAYLPALQEKLEHDKSEPGRRQRKAMRVYKELRSLGYTGTYEAVNNYIKKWKLKDGKQGSAKVFVPLEFEPGEAFQFDWSEEEVELAGEITRIKVAHIRLAYSRFFLVVAFVNEQLEMVMEAHNRAFEFFEGVCKKGIYDNMKTAIQKILVGKDRIFNKRFSELASHYLFEPIACTPAAGWEKGQVEHQVETSRSNFFTPLVKIGSLEELNQKLKSQCIEWAKSTKHPAIKDKTTWEIYQEEKPFLLHYQHRFDGFKIQPTTVSSYSLIQYDTNSYSVDCAYVGKEADIRIYWDSIVVLHHNTVIGKHPRCFKKHKKIYDPWHYVSVLETKPGALRNGAPFKQLDLPEVITKVRQKLQRYSDGEKQFITLLLKANGLGLNILENACEKALTLGISNADWIIKTMENKNQTEDPTLSDKNQNLLLKTKSDEDCNEYNKMLLVMLVTDKPIKENLLTGGLS